MRVPGRFIPPRDQKDAPRARLVIRSIGRPVFAHRAAALIMAQAKRLVPTITLLFHFGIQADHNRAFRSNAHGIPRKSSSFRSPDCAREITLPEEPTAFRHSVVLKF